MLTCARFWMIWKCNLRRIMTFICRPAIVDIWYTHWIFIQKKQKQEKPSEKKFDVNTRYLRRARWDFRGVLDDSLFLYLEFHMNKYLKNWRNYEVLPIKLGGDLLLPLFLFMEASLRKDDFVCEFEFLLYWPFHTYNSQFLLMCFCVYIHILPFCCMQYLSIFLRSSIALVILPVSILLLFMPLFSEPCLLFYSSSLTEDPWSSAYP